MLYWDYPLWKTTKKSNGFNDVWFYHCDHLGSPQEMSDHTGAIIWTAQYKAWGELVSAKQRFARAQDESYARSGKSEKGLCCTNLALDAYLVISFQNE